MIPPFVSLNVSFYIKLWLDQILNKNVKVAFNSIWSIFHIHNVSIDIKFLYNQILDKKYVQEKSEIFNIIVALSWLEWPFGHFVYEKFASF